MTNPNQLISIIIPVFNESESIGYLLDEVLNVMSSNKLNFEIVVVNDGSQDSTSNVLDELTINIKELSVISLRTNYGQTAAMAAGFDNSNGEVVITLDGDLQNDPNDIPKLISHINEGYDLICGWRYDRKDKLINRRIPSKIANKLIANVTGLKLHDYGCSLKAFKKEILDDIKLYGELHRFLPVLAKIEGAKIKEIKVNHRSRKYGSSKYGIDRTFRVLMDLLTVWFMTKFLTRPMYGFGFVGIISILVSLGMTSYLFIIKLLGNDIGNRPMLMFALILGIAGVQLFSFGLLGELLIRTYHESQNRPIYRIRKIQSISNE
ncbi:Glycosyl transferase, family 2 [Prochlorococcus marinus subsp. pastoris str. CCMP1986]|uniref:Glycosyl transferase, family 2 n=1 Tax=Prochlorococcus marinus subsp. pastoris (strain CCMP1986 / NIES-2087 / MED4) TaxID=59919 RepID=Q7UZX4_PROMP|nr:glycosyltransferase family 2 protein [Prochlorococcus marinus]KGF86772.1 Glycosyltransferase [Prochlorococcus marinus str. EQPAC1]CAE19981.1 Glycosyl transferase, family 2 [Prochlorococcus marinus subsp. pastoris str. CCMP1986]